MRRIVWAGVGAVIAVVVVYQVGRARSAADSVARTLTTEGLADAVTRGVAELRALGAELTTAMREQEDRLTADLLPDPADEADARTYRASRPRRAARGAEDPWDDPDF